jgi:queuosine biosynthesis protein QueC
MDSVVLLSGGLDSTVSLAQSLREGEVKLCLTFDYGQRAAAKEIEASAAIAGHYGLAHRVIPIDFLAEITRTALVNRDMELPSPGENELDDMDAALGSAAAVWVPNRNGLFINIAASFAESMACGQVVTGFNREEAATFPDNTLDYVRAATRALSFSTANKVRVVSYTQMLDKVEIVRLGKRLGVPFANVWSCYRQGERMCGKCESCRRFNRAMELAGNI